MPRLDPYDKRHLQNVEAYLKKLDAIYAQAIEKASQIGSKVANTGKSPYNFSISPYKKQLDAIYNRMAKDMEATIFNGIGAEWKFGDKKGLDQAMSALKGKISKEAFEKASALKFGSTEPALKQFLNRKDQGLNLSDRVWRYRDQFKNEMEMALQVGINSGTPAKKLASEMKQYLQNPDKLFRRHRDEFGVLRPSKNMKAFHPGTGVYKSSYKNACRLTRTEVNMAYRGAENARYQRLPFVRGFEVNLSNAHPQIDICDDLKGKYPADFVYKGWHPQCLCYTTPIMISDEEFDRLQEDIMAGKDISSLNYDKRPIKVPEGFTNWIQRNEERMQGWKQVPYFVKDNIIKPGISNFTSAESALSNVNKALAGNMDTATLYRNNLGGYIAERKALHSEIIEKFMKMETTEDRVVYMLGGAPANGKSTLVDSKLLPHGKTMVLDPDKIKAELPEYKAMLDSGKREYITHAAQLVHEESSYLSKLIQKEALSRNKDFVLDGVNDGGIDAVITKLDKFKAAGRRIRADYVSLDTGLSETLAIERAKRTGRMVPLGYVNKMNSEVSKLVPELIKRKSIDELYLWDTNINGKPRLILKQIDGKLTIYDRKLYNDFLNKAK